MIGLTQMEGAIYLPVWEGGIQLKPFILNARLQLGGLFLTAFLGGKNAAILAQGMYLTLGLWGWNDLRVFGEGGGLGYWQEPTFGYLLGFLPASYLAGMEAFSRPKDLVNFAWSGILALLVVHLTGMGYLLLRFLTQPHLLFSYWLKYSVLLLPSHLAILCSCSLIAYIIRLVLLY